MSCTCVDCGLNGKLQFLSSTKASPSIVDIDLIIEDIVILELKCVERVLAIHEAQLLTYLKLLDKPVGFIINFNVPILRQGIVRKVFDSASPRLRGE